MRASVIIPNWNGAELLRACLASLERQTIAGQFEVIVVDGASEDHSADVVQRAADVRWLPLAANRGFAPAANAGIAAAGAPVLVLLNNDTEAEPEWLAELLAGLEDSGADMAASKVLTMERRNVLHNAGDTVDLAGRAANRGVWEEDHGQWDERRDVFAPNGAAAAYTRRLLDTVGVFSETFGSYLEDVDLAWRARLAGFRCEFVPAAVVYHCVSATGGGPYASYHVARNRVWLIARCYPARLLVHNAGRVAAGLTGEAWRALRAIRGAAARATLRGLAVGVVTWPCMLAERRTIMARRRIDDEALAALLRAAGPP